MTRSAEAEDTAKDQHERVNPHRIEDKPGRRFLVTLKSTWGKRKRYFPYGKSRADALKESRDFYNSQQSTLWNYLHNVENSSNNVPGQDVGVEENPESDEDGDGRLYEVSTIAEVKMVDQQWQGKCMWKPSFRPLKKLIEDCPDLVNQFVSRARKRRNNARVSATGLAGIGQVFEEVERQNAEVDKEAE
eukprot:GHVU01058740.1.p1 GENE.GHVU01058740.1~~GHVU01058740.1.p1  ORF type:complete len:189 (+),score=23.43 GHVU01058740.1:73-639(+)